MTVANFYERLITYRTLKIAIYASVDRWLADRRKTEKAEPNRELWLAIVFARAPSASIKTIANAKMSVACPATRRDGRRRLKLRNKEAKVRNFKLQTSNLKLRKWKSSNFKTWNCESEQLQTSNLNLQTWIFKLRKWKSSNLSLQISKVKIFRLESSNFKSESLQS